MVDLTCVDWDYASNKSRNKYLHKFFNLYKDMSIDMSSYNSVSISDIDNLEQELYLRSTLRSKIFLYLKDENIVAYIVLSPDDRSKFRVWLDELFVDMRYRNRGYGSYIVKNTISIAKKLNYKELFLQVSEHNKIAKAIYEVNGFVRYLDLKKLDLEYLTFINHRVYSLNLE